MTDRLPRPAEVPAFITDEVLREIVIQFMSGARVSDLCQFLTMQPAEFRRMMASPRWQELLEEVKSTIVTSRLGSVHNIEQRLLNQIEDMLDNGVESVTALGEHYTRKLSPKEVASLSTVMQTYQKNVEKIASKPAGRTILSTAQRIAALETFATGVKVAPVETVYTVYPPQDAH